MGRQRSPFFVCIAGCFFPEESNSTRKLFQILIRLLDVVKNRSDIMLGKFDVGSHVRLADFILDLIHASEGSLLMSSSHNTNLIDIKRLNRLYQ